jgi:hypothetical protein
LTPKALKIKYFGLLELKNSKALMKIYLALAAANINSL